MGFLHERPESYRMLQHQHRQSTFESSSASLDINNTDESQILPKRWHWVIRETQAVSLWSCTSMLVRLAFRSLISLASREDSEASRLFSDLLSSYGLLPPQQATDMILTAASVLASWVVFLLPKRLVTGQNPGFFVSNPE